MIVPEHSHATVACEFDDTFLTLSFKKKTDRLWRFAGGKIDVGENPIQAAARELKEELGVDALDLKFVMRNEHFVDGNLWTGFWFVCHRTDGAPRIQEPEKHGEIQWLSLEELGERDCHPEFEVAHKIVLEGL